MRPATPEEIENARWNPNAVQNSNFWTQEPGIAGKLKGIWARGVAKNLAAGPEQARAYLESFKDDNNEPLWEVEDLPPSFGADLNFAIRRKGTQLPFYVLDPSKGNWKDWVFDLTDIMADMAMGTVTTAVAVKGGVAGGLAGGPVGAFFGAMGGGAAGAGLGETGREVIGHLAGVPDNVQEREILASAAAGSLVPVAGAATRVAGRFGLKVAHSVREFGAFTAGIKPVAGMTRGEVLAARAADKAGIGKSMVTDDEAATVARTVIGKVAATPLPEGVMAHQLATQAASKGVKSNFTSIIQRLEANAAGPENAVTTELREKLSSSPKLRMESKRLINRIQEFLGDAPDDAVPADAGTRFVKFLQDQARDRGGFIMTKLGSKSESKAIKSEFSALAHEARMIVASDMEKAGYQDFPLIMKVWSGKLDKLRMLEDAYGIRLDAVKGMDKAKATINKAFRPPTGSAIRHHLRNAELLLGLPDGSLFQMAKRVAIGKAVNPETAGKPGLRPVLAASGLPRGAIMGGLLSGSLGPMLGQDVVGSAATGTALGMVAASPRVVVAGDKTAQALFRAGSAIMGTRVPQTAAAAAALAASRRGAEAVVVTEADDNRRRRRPLRIE